MKRIVASGILLSLSIHAFAQVPAYVPANGLKGFWLFSGNANDVSSNGNNGTVFGATLTVDRFNSANSAYSFNGSGNYILTNYAGILGTNPRSVSFWARTQSTAIMSGVAWGANGTAARYEAGFNYGSPGPMLDGGNGVITYSPQSSVNDNSWHHYVMQFGTSSTLSQVEVYQDAVLLTVPANVYNGSNTLNTLNVFNVQFGRFDAFPYHYFDGQLDDIGIWDRPLTPCEIKQLYKASPALSLSVSPNSTICPGQSKILTASGASSYSWNTGSQNASIVVNPLVTTSYTVSAISENCPVKLAVQVAVSECVGLDSERVQTEVDLFPVPASDYVWISSDGPVEKVEIFDAKGLLLSEPAISARGVSVSGLESGLYYFRIHEGGRTVVRKFIKE